MPRSSSAEELEFSEDERLRNAVGNAKPGWVKVCDLLVDNRYQRQINSRRVREIVRNFDPDAFGVMYVSQRLDGTLVLLDGQHRRQALMEMGWNDQQMPAFVYSGLTLAAEAKIFRIMNEGRARPTAIDLFRTKLVEKDPQSLAIQRILASHDLRIQASPEPGFVRCITACERVFADAGRPTFAAVFNIISGAWPTYEDQNCYGSDIVLGLGMVLSEYGSELDTGKLTAMLSKELPANIIARARQLKQLQGGTAGTNMAATLVTIYNKGRRTRRLEDWAQRPYRRNPMLPRDKDQG